MRDLSPVTESPPRVRTHRRHNFPNKNFHGFPYPVLTGLRARATPLRRHLDRLPSAYTNITRTNAGRLCAAAWECKCPRHAGWLHCTRARLATNVRCQRDDVVRLICVSASINAIGGKRACVAVLHARQKAFAAAAEAPEQPRSISDMQQYEHTSRAAWRCSTYARAPAPISGSTMFYCAQSIYRISIYLYEISCCNTVDGFLVRICERMHVHSIFVQRNVLWRTIYYCTHMHVGVVVPARQTIETTNATIGTDRFDVLYSMLNGKCRKCKYLRLCSIWIQLNYIEKNISTTKKIYS